VLGDIPILGELFKSHDYRERQTELVILVTPHIISGLEAPEPQMPQFKEDFEKKFRGFEGRMGHSDRP